MNFLAHLYLVRDDDALMLGGLFGDFVRGLRALRGYDPDIREGIRLHRFIDRTTDQDRDVKALVRTFPMPFRRYAGIIVDLAFDHELSRHWGEFCDVPIEDFDAHWRALLATYEGAVPGGLEDFLGYADRRGLFAAYASEDEMLWSLAGIGTRLKRDNPLHRVGEIWPEVRADCRAAFQRVMPRVQGEVSGWRNRRSTTTGS